MSNGYLVAAAADLAAAAEISDGFGLEVIDAGADGNHEAVGAALAAAANVGLMLSAAAAQDPGFVALVGVLAARLARAQLILVEPEARSAFAMLPEAWPAMSLDDARARAQALVEARQTHSDEPPRAAPAPKQAQAEAPPMADEGPQQDLNEQPAPETPPVGADDARAATREQEAELDRMARSPTEEALEATAGAEEDGRAAQKTAEPPAAPPAATPPLLPPDVVLSAPNDGPMIGSVIGGLGAPPSSDARAPAPTPEPPPSAQPGPPRATEPQAPAAARKREAPAPATANHSRASSTGETATAATPADATAFAPKKLRRGDPELVRIAIHQPKDLQAVIRAARKADPRTSSAPQSMNVGQLALGASVGVSLEIKGGACDGALQRQIWTSAPLDFCFAVTADADVRQVVMLARVFVDDAQIGVLAFTRGVTGPKPKALADGERVRLKRHKRVFLSYSSKDRETVSAIATAYQAAGVQYFWDRTSLKSGEEWSPRLRQEIDRADLFHLCWSKSAAASPWVEKETTHALNRRRRAKKPEITVQMLDGPPWAPHPPQLDAINFDDFVRAAIVGYARGEE